MDTIAIQMAEPIPPGKTLAVRVTSPEGAREVSLETEHTRPLPDGSHLVVARASEPIPQPAIPGARQDVRVAERIRAMSPDLPAYHALTVDCSLGGLQLETTEPVEVGDVLDLWLGLRDIGPDVPGTVEVLWCERWTERSYRFGCRFLEPTPELREALHGFMQLKLGEVPRVSPPPEPRPRRRVVEVEDSEPYERAELKAVLEGFEVDGQDVRIRLQLEEGETREVEIPNVISLSDHRGRSGMQVSYLACRRMPGRSRIRFLSPWQEDVLEIEAERGTAWSA